MRPRDIGVHTHTTRKSIALRKAYLLPSLHSCIRIYAGLPWPQALELQTKLAGCTLSGVRDLATASRELR